MPLLVFYPLAALAVVSALVMVTRKNPIASALSLSVTLVCLAGIFAGLSAGFLFALQLLVYAGAIMVLVIFVIMLLNLREKDLLTEGPNVVRGGVATAAAAILLLVFGRLLARADLPLPRIAAGFGDAHSVARLLFESYVIPFEIVSLLLLVAIVGAVVLAKRHF